MGLGWYALEGVVDLDLDLDCFPWRLLQRSLQRKNLTQDSSDGEFVLAPFSTA